MAKCYQNITLTSWPKPREMKPPDIPLVRGGKLTPEMIAWIEKVSKVFPGVEKDIVIIRKPSSNLIAREGTGDFTKREKQRPKYADDRTSIKKTKRRR
jgi:hypothetical protein